MSAKSRPCLWFASAVVSAFMILPVFASTGERGLRIRHFELLQTVDRISQVSRDSESAAPLVLQFHAYGRDFKLHLEPNERLAAAAVHSNVGLFAGVIDGAPNSWARISVTAAATRGMFWDGQHLYLLDSARVLEPAAASTLKADDTVIYRLADLVGGQASTASSRSSEADAYHDVLNAMDPSMTAPAMPGFQLRISVLGDAAFRARYASDSQAQEEILTRLNNVDGIFGAQLGVQIQVAAIDTRDAATASLATFNDASTLLSQLARLRSRESQLSAQAITFLFTGRRLAGDQVGLAYTQSLCSPAYSAGFARTSDNSGLDSLVAAHEIAHILGAPHDGEKQCANTPKSRFLMTPALVSSESIFSPCSVASMRPQIQAASCVVALNDAEHPAGQRFAAIPAVDADAAISSDERDGAEH